MDEENHMGWRLVRGVRRDVVNLFQLFASSGSVRFEDFCAVWKKMNFSLIYSNRSLFIELLEFTEELLQIIKEYLSSVYEFHTRVAALYALYGLYFKQPIRGAAKIRFTKSEWEEIYTFVENCKMAKHYDIAFIFFKLYLSGAYTFTATARPAGLERGYKKYSEKKVSPLSKACDTELLYRPLISEKLVNSLIKLESLYCQKKSKLLGNKNLVFINGEFAQSLKEELKNYEQAARSQCNVNKKVQVDPETPSDEDTSQRLVTRNLKNKKKLDPNENDDENSVKKDRPRKKYLEIMAKKKARYYIKKFMRENDEDCSNKNQKLLDLLPLDDSESLEDIKYEDELANVVKTQPLEKRRLSSNPCSAKKRFSVLLHRSIIPLKYSARKDLAADYPPTTECSKMQAVCARRSKLFKPATPSGKSMLKKRRKK